MSSVWAGQILGSCPQLWLDGGGGQVEMFCDGKKNPPPLESLKTFRCLPTAVTPMKKSEVKQHVKHILLYCNRGILQESRRIFTNHYKQYVPGFENLCDDKKLNEILNVHPKYNETCRDVTTEEICKFIKKVCNAIWIFNTVMWNHLNNNNVLVNKCKTHLFYYVYGADLMHHPLVK